MSGDNDTLLPQQDELAALKARADAMQITYHPSIGVEKLREKVNAAINGTNLPADDNKADSAALPATINMVLPEAVPAAAETPGQRRKRIKLDATRLIRVNITCMNPAKREWTGEIFTVGNSVIGTVRRFVPFNTSEGWHVEAVLLQQIRDRKCQIFVSGKSKAGVTVRQGKLINEFAVEELPAMSRAEIDELARRQAMAGTVEA